MNKIARFILPFLFMALLSWPGKTPYAHSEVANPKTVREKAARLYQLILDSRKTVHQGKSVASVRGLNDDSARPPTYCYWPPPKPKSKNTSAKVRVEELNVFAEGVDLLKAEKWPQANESLTKFIEKYPKSPLAVEAQTLLTELNSLSAQ